MFGRRSQRSAEDSEDHALAGAVRRHLPDADVETRRVVTAVAGLLAGVAYADRDYSSEEEARVRAELERVHGMTPRGIEVVLQTLREDIVLVATVQSPRYCRALVELGDRDLRLEILGMLVELAAADGEISHDEATLLRNTTRALGLDQSDYNALQARHRDKLALLK